MPLKLKNISTTLINRLYFKNRIRPIQKISTLYEHAYIFDKQDRIKGILYDQRIFPIKFRNWNSITFCNISTSSERNVTTVREYLNRMKKDLESENINEAELHAEYLLAKILKISRCNLFLEMETVLSSDQIKEIDHMLCCSLTRLPLHYILGDWDFHSIELKLIPPVFIPRSETEELVNLCLSHLSNITKASVMEIGCGSGAISLALLHNDSSLKRVLAIDQSKYATDLTKLNAQNLCLDERLTVFKCKLTDEGFSPSITDDKFDFIVSNPPYILRKDMSKLAPEIHLFEDLRALDGGAEGLDVIKNIVLHGPKFLKNEGLIFMEIDPCHEILIPEMLNKVPSQMKIRQFHKDLYGRCRFVVLEKTCN